jgi:hypothetical protein
LTDTYSATSFLRGESYFTNHSKYAVLWEPGEYVRWYLDDQLLFEINKEALKRQVIGQHTPWPPCVLRSLADCSLSSIR